MVNGNSADVTVLVSRRGDDGTAQIQTLHLIKSGGTWYIDSIKLGNVVPISSTTPAS